jgi:hypothetical protein
VVNGLRDRVGRLTRSSLAKNLIIFEGIDAVAICELGRVNGADDLGLASFGINFISLSVMETIHFSECHRIFIATVVIKA